MRRVSILLVFSAVFSGCMGASSARLDTSPLPAAAAPASLPAARSHDTPAYSSYRTGVIGSGQPVLLFFFSAQEPFSQQTNQRLQTLYDASAFPISTYRINIDTEQDLKRRYLVLSEDTVVLVDSDGNKVASSIHPSEGDLKDLLSRYSILR